MREIHRRVVHDEMWPCAFGGPDLQGVRRADEGMDAKI